MAISLSFAETHYFSISKTNTATFEIDQHGGVPTTFELKIPSIGKFPKIANDEMYDYFRVENFFCIHDLWNVAQNTAARKKFCEQAVLQWTVNT